MTEPTYLLTEAQVTRLIHNATLAVDVELLQSLPMVSGEPVAWVNKDSTYVELATKSTIYGSHTIPLYTSPQAPVANKPTTCLIGIKGSSFDLPTTKRAYTYAEQPHNLAANRLGEACNAANRQSAGDSIDRGLGLLQELEKVGFGVFDLGAEFTQPLTPITADDVTDEMIKDIFPTSFQTLSKNSAMYEQVKRDSANIYNAVIKHRIEA